MAGSLFVLSGGNSSTAATWQVQSLADAGPGTLREAIEAANAAGGGDIDCRQLTGLIEIASPLPGFVQSVRVLGPEPTQGSLNVSGGGAWPLLSFNPGTTSLISRLTLSRAVAKAYRHGAAISNAGSLRIENCLIVSNRTEGGWGGGIYNAGDLSLEGVELRANAAVGATGGNSGIAPDSRSYAPGGGGAGFGGAVFQESGTLELRDCHLTGNRASGGPSGLYASKSSEEGDGRGGGPFGGQLGQDGGFGSGGGGIPIDSREGRRGGFGGGDSGPTPEYRPFGGGQGGEGSFLFYRPGPGAGAGMGGGIFVRGGRVEISRSLFMTNFAVGGIVQPSGGFSGDAVGAALLVYGGEVQVNRCRFEANDARMASEVLYKLWDLGGGDCRGAGMALVDGELAVTSSILISNRVTGGPNGANGLGAGFYQYGGTSKVYQVSLVGNEAFGGTPGTAKASFTLGSGYGFGGGACIEGGSAEFENCTLANNRARGADNFVIGEDTEANVVLKLGKSLGAGLCVRTERTNVSTTVLLRYCTVSGNKAERSALSYAFLPIPPQPLGKAFGGGIYVEGDRAEIHLSGTLSADNQAVDGTDVWGSIHSTRRNLIGKSAGGTGWSATDLVDVDARLGPLVAQGPFAWVRVPLTNSPAVDAADAVDLPRLDQRWIARPQGVAGDIGAVELTGDPTAPFARFSGLGLGPNRAVMFRVSGPTNWSHRLERSVDLRTWEQVGPVEAGGEVAIPIGADLGIYRVWSQPAEW